MYFYRSFVIIMMAFAIALSGCGESEIGKGTKEERLHRSLSDIARYSHDTAFKEAELLVKETEKGSKAWQQALHTKATAILHRFPLGADKIAEAHELLEELIKEVPNEYYGLRAQLTIGRIHELRDYNNDVIDLSSAREAYQQVIDRAGDQPIAHEAVLRLAGSYVQTYIKEDVNKGLALLKEWLEKYPDNEYNVVMYQYMARMYLVPLDDAENAVKYWIKADELGLVTKTKAGAIYWQIAELSRERLNDNKTALKYYRKIILQAASSGRAYEAQHRMRALGVDPPALEMLELASQVKSNTTQPAGDK